MRTISTGEPSTLATYRRMALVISGFDEQSSCVKFIDKKISESKDRENTEVVADETQMLILFAELLRQDKLNKE